MIEVTTYRSGELVATAEAEDAESAMLAGQTLYDEAWDLSHVQGGGRAITTVFTNDGEHVRTVEGRRPV